MTPASDTVLVLDLDDTLYREIDYVISGAKHIAQLLQQLTGVKLETDLQSFIQQNPAGDFLNFAIGKSNFPQSSKEALLWSYRVHSPDIRLSKEVHSWVNDCRQKFHAVAILTDGRTVTQRLKLASLKLGDLPAYISEDWQSTKPDPKRFLAIQNRWPVKHYIYVGDNPAKDFITPNSLGWGTIGLESQGHNIHPQNTIPDISHAPQRWVEKLPEIVI